MITILPILGTFACMVALVISALGAGSSIQCGSFKTAGFFLMLMIASAVGTTVCIEKTNAVYEGILSND